MAEFRHLSYRTIAPVVNVLTTIVTTVLQFFKPPAPLQEPKPYRSVTLLAPSRQIVSFHPALAAAIGQNKAIILQKMLDWMDYNHATNKVDHLINGEWYTYDSARGWQQRHFHFIAVSTVKRLMQELEAEGFLKRRQHQKAWGDYRQWVTIPAEARARIDALCDQYELTPAHEKQGGDQKNPPAESLALPPAQKNPQTKRESSNKESPNLETKSQTQQQTTTADVVVSPHSVTQEAETGETLINAEIPQDCYDGMRDEPASVKAPVSQHANNTPIPSSAPPLSPQVPDTLRADLIRFGVMPHTARRLVNQYGETDTRKVLTYAQSQRALGPGFVIDELDHKRFGVLVAPVSQPTIHRPPDYFSDHDPLPPAVDDPFWNELIETCAVSIPELKYAVCRAAGDRYEIAVEGSWVYLPLNRRRVDIQQHLERLTGHPVALTLIVDPRLECDPVS